MWSRTDSWKWKKRGNKTCKEQFTDNSDREK